MQKCDKTTEDVTANCLAWIMVMELLIGCVGCKAALELPFLSPEAMRPIRLAVDGCDRLLL